MLLDQLLEDVASPYNTICISCNKPYFKHHLRMIYCSKRCKEREKERRKTKREKALGLKQYPPKRKRNKKWTQEEVTEKYKKDKLRASNRYYLNTFGITRERAYELKMKQSNCDLCGTNDPSTRDGLFVIDHCSETGIIRGLLCNNCNRGIGWLKHDLGRIACAMHYLNKIFIR